jgi:hypothetical protein
VTDGAGIYVVSALQPGPYEIEVESPGFKRDVCGGIILEVAQAARVDFTESASRR